MGGAEEEVKKEEKHKEEGKEKEEKPKKEKKKDKDKGDKKEKKKKSPEEKNDPTQLRAKLEKVESKIRDLMAKKDDILKLIEAAEKDAASASASEVPKEE